MNSSQLCFIYRVYDIYVLNLNKKIYWVDNIILIISKYYLDLRLKLFQMLCSGAEDSAYHIVRNIVEHRMLNLMQIPVGWLASYIYDMNTVYSVKAKSITIKHEILGQRPSWTRSSKTDTQGTTFSVRQVGLESR